MVKVVDQLDNFIENIKNRNYHLGQMVWDCFSSKAPGDICLIDANTGESRTYGSVRERSLRLAQSFKNADLKPGDVLAFSGRNHLDVYIPYYAASLNGMPMVGIDTFYKLDEIKSLFMKTKPKIAFCQLESEESFKLAARDSGLNTTVVTYDAGDNSMEKYVEKYYRNEPLNKYIIPKFDIDKIYAWLVPTSGTTGKSKVAALSHRPLIEEMIEYIMYLKAQGKCDGGKLALNISPVQWISSYFNAIGQPIKNNVILQTSKPLDTEHLIDIIDKYKPVEVAASPAIISSILKSDKPCDLACFKSIMLTGSKVHKSMLEELESRTSPTTKIIEMYGQTETIGLVLLPNGIHGSCGVATTKRPVKLMDLDTGTEITEPNAIGELWTKGPRFTEYYGDLEATAAAFSPDGWYKTGDLLYRDELNNYYYADRLKMMIKYRGYNIMPPELEEVISSLKGVLAVAVTSIPHAVDCERPVACVVRDTGDTITAEDVKAIVAEKLSEKKGLSGGVVFLDSLPMTSTGKIARAKMREIVKTAPRDGAFTD